MTKEAILQNSNIYWTNWTKWKKMIENIYLENKKTIENV